MACYLAAPTLHPTPLPPPSPTGAGRPSPQLDHVLGNRTAQCHPPLEGPPEAQKDWQGAGVQAWRSKCGTCHVPMCMCSWN